MSTVRVVYDQHGVVLAIDGFALVVAVDAEDGCGRVELDDIANFEGATGHIKVCLLLRRDDRARAAALEVSP